MGGGSSSKQPDPLYVDMGLPSGRLWAKSNLDVTQPNGFAASPFQYSCTFYSWGNTEGHNPIPNDGFSYNWGTWENSKNDDGTEYLPTSPYGLTDGCSLQANIDTLHDAAHVSLGLPWHIPTKEDYNELINNCNFVEADGTTIIVQTNKIITMNDVKGIYIKSKINGNLLFFACTGLGSARSWSDRGVTGYYWTSSYISPVYVWGFNCGIVVHPQYSNHRNYGFAVRPVI